MTYKSVDELLALLAERGLQIPDIAYARHYLTTVGHHRLGAFYQLFYSAADKQFDTDIPTTMENVVHLYSFDRRLRLLINGPLEKIEVALRALIIQEIGDYIQARQGPNTAIDLNDQTLFNLKTNQSRRNLELAREGFEKGVWAGWIAPFSRSHGKGFTKAQRDAAFRQHYAALPAWKILQAASFGPLTHYYSALRNEIAFPIARRFGLAHPVFTTTLFAFKELRNACAHHEPIWNWDAKKRSVKLLFPKAYTAAVGVEASNENRLYPYCALIHLFLSYLSQGQSTWYRRLKKLVNEYNTVYSSSMGFPDDWQQRTFWCVSDVSRSIQHDRLRTRVTNPRP